MTVEQLSKGWKSWRRRCGIEHCFDEVVAGDEGGIGLRMAAARAREILRFCQ